MFSIDGLISSLIGIFSALVFLSKARFEVMVCLSVNNIIIAFPCDYLLELSSN